jgi:ATP-dependent DNA helicase RecG
MNIIDFLKQPEGKTLEFKRDLSSPTKIIHTIIAFANTAGGTLIIGVDDDTHYILGIENPHQDEEKLVNFINDHITPHLIPKIDILSWRDAHLLMVRVFPSANKPHFHKKQGEAEGVYIRVGSTNRHADPEMIKELQRMVRNETFDEQPLTQLDSEAIDFEAVSEQFKHVRKLNKKDLESLEIVTTYQGKIVPTVAGMLLFGKHREKCFPDAWIQAGRFQGHDKTNIIDNAAFHGGFIEALGQALEFVEKHAMQGLKIEGLKHQKDWNMPMKAIREAIINAVVHADYSQRGTPIRLAIFDDCVEIENPGLLSFGLTIPDIKQGISKLRNRIIGHIFHTVGLIERWGSGIQRIISTCKSEGFPEPKFEELATHFRVTIFTTKDQLNPALDATNRAIVRILKQYQEGMATHTIAKKIDLSTRATRTRLLKLIAMGLVIELASSSHDPGRLYFLNDLINAD